jgi:hypothetical protein
VKKSFRDEAIEAVLCCAGNELPWHSEKYRGVKLAASDWRRTLGEAQAILNDARAACLQIEREEPTPAVEA